MSNTSLHAAKKTKNDEFYTQLTDIENELRHYSSILKIRLCFATAMIRLNPIFLNTSY